MPRRRGPRVTTSDGVDRIAEAREHFPVYMALVHRTDMAEMDDGLAIPAAHHIEMMRALGRSIEGEPHTLIVAPRGSAKTTLVQAWIEWQLGRASMSKDPEWANKFRVMYFSATAFQAYSISVAIKNVIAANDIFKAIFPKVKPDPDKWSEPEWKVKGNVIKDSTFKAMGAGGPALGSRAELMVFDDIGDEDNMATRLQREKICGSEDGNHPGWLDSTALPILVPWGRMLMLATRWAYWDPPAWAMKQGWKTLVMKALVEDDTASEAVELKTFESAGTESGDVLLLKGNEANSRLRSYWPERFSVEWLLDKKDKAPGAFAKQYQNEVTPEEGLLFQRDWFPRFAHLPAECLFRIDSWDTAASTGPRSSYTVGLCGFVTTDWHIYLYHRDKFKAHYGAVKDGIRAIHDKTKANIVVIEKKSTGEAALDDLRREGINVQPWAPAGERGAVATKEQAAEWVTEYCEQGKVHLCDEVYARGTGYDWTGDFMQDVLGYEGKESPGADTVDALTQMVLYVHTRRVQMRSLLEDRPRLEWGVDTGGRVRV